MPPSVIEALASFANDPPTGDQWPVFVQALTGQMLLYEARITELVGQAVKAEMIGNRAQKTDTQELIGGSALKPDKFGNDSKGGNLRKWANQVRIYLGSRKREYQEMLDRAELHDEPITLEVLLDMGDDKRIDKIQELNDTIFNVLVFLTDEDAAIIVENSKKNGVEAWRMLHERWLHRSKMGATEISDQLRSMARPKAIGDSYKMIQDAERLYTEWERHRGKPYDDVEKRAVLMRIVPEEYAKKMRNDFDLDDTDYKVFISSSGRIRWDRQRWTSTTLRHGRNPWPMKIAIQKPQKGLSSSVWEAKVKARASRAIATIVADGAIPARIAPREVQEARTKEKGRATTIRAKAKVRRGTTAKVTMAKVEGIPVVTTTTRDTTATRARAKASPPTPLRTGQLGAHPRGRSLATWERGNTQLRRKYRRCTWEKAS